MSPGASRRIPALHLATIYLSLAFCVLRFVSGSYSECVQRISQWHENEMRVLESLPVQHTGENKPELLPLLFFLHIPRTGGRSYHQCFLKALFPPAERCPRSYDFLRMDTTNPECRLLATHDDYSLMTRLPINATSVITNLRDPGERLLSSYEFLVEISARSLKFYPGQNASSLARKTIEDLRRRPGSMQRTETRNVWPWSQLIPYIESDMWRRRDEDPSNLSPDNGPYDTPRLAMPFAEFIKHPVVKDLLHNGGTMQITGLTNYSSIPDAHKIRQCALEHDDLGQKVLEVAKRRLDRMLYVGLTEQHDRSARLFARVIHRSIFSPAFIQIGENRAVKRLDLGERIRRKGNFDGKLNRRVQERINRGDRSAVPRMSVMQHYTRCVKQNRDRNDMRRGMALKPIQPIMFSKQARTEIPAEILNQVMDMNRLDLELLDYGREIFKRELKLYGHNIDKTEEEMEEELRKEEQQKEILERQKSVNVSSREKVPAVEDSSPTVLDRENAEQKTVTEASVDGAPADGVVEVKQSAEVKVGVQPEFDGTIAEVHPDHFGALVWSILGIAGVAGTSLLFRVQKVPSKAS